MMKKRTDRGVTMLEVVIATAILLAIFGMVFMLLFSASDEEATQQTMLQLDQQILTALNTISEDIRNGGGTFAMNDFPGTNPCTLVVGDPLQKDYPNACYSLSFGKNTGFVVTGKVGAAQFNQVTIRYYWRSAVGEIAGNGIDDNNDGFIDEGDLVREEWTAGVLTNTSRIVRNVSSKGIGFQFANTTTNTNSFTVVLELMSKDKKGKVFTRRGFQSAAART